MRGCRGISPACFSSSKCKLAQQSGDFLRRLLGAICISGVDGMSQKLSLLWGRAACSDMLLNVYYCFPFGRKHPVAAPQSSYGLGLTGEAGISNSRFLKVSLNFSHPDRAFVLALSLSPSSLSVLFQTSLLPYSLSFALKQTKYLSPTFKEAHGRFFSCLQIRRAEVSSHRSGISKNAPKMRTCPRAASPARLCTVARRQ